MPMQNKQFHQSGFLISEMAVGMLLFLVVMTGVSSYLVKRNNDTLWDQSALMVGESLAEIDDAVKQYSTEFFVPIQTGAEIIRNGQGVADRLNPTVIELSNMGLLESRYTVPTKYGDQDINFLTRLSVDTSTGCVIPACNIRHIVYTSVPLRLKDGTDIDLRRASMAASRASPANAGVSMTESPAVLTGERGVTVASNPLPGTPGIVGVVNGYQSEGMMVFDRRDGSLPRTGRLNMAGHNIDGANVVSSASINNSGTIATGVLSAGSVTATGRVSAGEFLQVKGTVVENTACPSNDLIARDAVGLILSCQSGIWRKAQGSGGTGIQGAMAPFRGMTASCGYIYASVDMSGNYRIYRNGGLQCTNRTPCIADMGETITFNGIGIEVRIPGSGGGGDGETSLDICRAYFPAS